MTPERAAEVLGLSRDATPPEIERAYHRRARTTHPDTAAGGGAGEAVESLDAGAAFREVTEARQVLLRAVVFPGRIVEATDPDGRPTPRIQGPGLLAVWGGLIVVAAFLAVFRTAYPLTIAEPLVRWGVLLVAAISYAATGRRVFAVLAVVAELASVVLTVRFASFGGLVALLITLPALLGAFTGGIARERLNRLAAR